MGNKYCLGGWNEIPSQDMLRSSLNHFQNNKDQFFQKQQDQTGPKELKFHRVNKISNFKRHIDSQNKPCKIKEEMTKDDFVFLYKIKKANYGDVDLVKYKKNNQTYVLKSIQKNKEFIDKQNRLVQLEKVVFQDNECPFIVNIKFAFQDNEMIYLVTEHAQGGNLKDFLRCNKILNQDLTTFYIAEIICGIKYITKQENFHHRDIRTENILIMDDGHLKISDFGVPNKFKEKIYNTESDDYDSPEIQNKKYMSPSFIIWQLGIICFEMMAGYHPFSNFIGTINQRKISQVIEYPNHFSEESKNFIQSMDFYSDMLQKNPNDRITLKYIKNHPFFKKIIWKDIEQKKNYPPIEERMSMTWTDGSFSKFIKSDVEN